MIYEYIWHEGWQQDKSCAAWQPWVRSRHIKKISNAVQNMGRHLGELGTMSMDVKLCQCKMQDVLSFLLITILLQAEGTCRQTEGTSLGRLSSSTQAASSMLAAQTPRRRSTCGLFCLIFHTIPHNSDANTAKSSYTKKNINQPNKITSSTLAPSCRPDMKPSAWSSEGKLLKNQWKSTWTKHNKTILTILYRVCYVLNVGEVHAVVVTLPS
jgi:hypothetical protein